MYKALISFSGLVSAVAGQVIDIPETWIAKDLLGAGLIEEIKPAKQEETPKATKPRTKKTPKGG